MLNSFSLTMCKATCVNSLGRDSNQGSFQTWPCEPAFVLLALNHFPELSGAMTSGWLSRGRSYQSPNCDSTPMKSWT